MLINKDYSERQLSDYLQVRYVTNRSIFSFVYSDTNFVYMIQHFVVTILD